LAQISIFLGEGEYLSSRGEYSKGTEDNLARNTRFDNPKHTHKLQYLYR